MSLSQIHICSGNIFSFFAKLVSDTLKNCKIDDGFFTVQNINDSSDIQRKSHKQEYSMDM